MNNCLKLLVLASHMAMWWARASLSAHLPPA